MTGCPCVKNAAGQIPLQPFKKANRSFRQREYARLIFY